MGRASRVKADRRATGEPRPLRPLRVPAEPMTLADAAHLLRDMAELRILGLRALAKDQWIASDTSANIRHEHAEMLGGLRKVYVQQGRPFGETDDDMREWYDLVTTAVKEQPVDG